VSKRHVKRQKKSGMKHGGLFNFIKKERRGEGAPIRLAIFDGTAARERHGELHGDLRAYGFGTARLVRDDHRPIGGGDHGGECAVVSHLPKHRDIQRDAHPQEGRKSMWRAA